MSKDELPRGSNMPRPAIFGGFRKSDVLAYVERISVGFQNEIASLKKQLSDARAERDEANVSRDAAVKTGGETEKLRASLRASYEELTDAKTALETARQRAAQLERLLGEERAARGESEKALETARGECAARLDELDAARGMAEKLRAERDGLRGELASKNDGLAAAAAERDAKNAELVRVTEAVSGVTKLTHDVLAAAGRLAEAVDGISTDIGR